MRTKKKHHERPYCEGGDRFIEKVEGDRFAVCKGGGGSSSTSTQNIPAELKPLANAYTTKAIGLSNQGFTPYTGDRYADLNQVQGAGIQGVIDRATNGSQTMNNAETALNDRFISGGPNPYLDSMVQRAQDSVKSNFNTGSINSGSFGNRNLEAEYGNNLSDVATRMYGQAYDADQGRALQAIGMAPTFGNQGYQDASQLLNAGQILQDQSQQDKDFSFQQYEAQQNLPYKQLAAMSGVFGSNLGGSSTQKSSDGGGK